MNIPLHNDLYERASCIQLLIFDVDGVLTDGTLYLSDSGQEYKAFYARDGHGMMMLHRVGMTMAVITGRTSQVVIHRMRNVGVEHIYQGYRDKLPAFLALLEATKVAPEHAAFVGDDVVDLPVMRRCGLSIAVADAHPLVKRYATWQTPHPGGRGAVRDVCELLLEAQGHLETLMQV